VNFSAKEARAGGNVRVNCRPERSSIRKLTATTREERVRTAETRHTQVSILTLYLLAKSEINFPSPQFAMSSEKSEKLEGTLCNIPETS
jgi:hypothetical protein